MQSNRILRELMRVEPEIGRELKPLRFASGDYIAFAGAPVTSVVFPDSGLLVRAVQFEDGGSVAGSMIGYRRALGVLGAIGGSKHSTDCVAMTDGSGWSLSVRALNEAAARNAELRAQLIRHENVVVSQVYRWAACGAKHPAQERFATFLMRMAAQSGARELTVTQDRMAELLSVRRSTLSTIATRFRDDGLLDYHRGRIRIDSGLTRAACDCCAVLSDSDRLLPAIAGSAQAAMS